MDGQPPPAFAAAAPAGCIPGVGLSFPPVSSLPPNMQPMTDDGLKPAWSESYVNCTILVAKIANLRSRYSVATPEDEMLFLHTVKEQFDNVSVKDDAVIWKVRARGSSAPFYCMHVSQCVPTSAAPAPTCL